MTQRSIASPLPSLDTIYSSHLLQRATKILNDPTHPRHTPTSPNIFTIEYSYSLNMNFNIHVLGRQMHVCVLFFSMLKGTFLHACRC